MQNEFEKQVRQKLDELNLAPSAPVWQNIKEQIKHQRDRRRKFLWLPLLFLVLTGGIWWFYSSNSNRTSPNDLVQKNVQPESAPTEKNSSNGPKNIQPKAEPNLPFSVTVKLDKALEQIRSFLNNKTGAIVVQQGNNEPIKTNDDNNVPPAAAIQKHAENTRTAAELADTIGVTHQLVDSIQLQLPKFDSPSRTIVTSAPKHKWQLGFSLSAGISGSTTGLNFSNNKSFMYNAPSTGSSSGSIYIPPSQEENGFSFSAGVVVRKQFNQRLSFSTGISYQYISTKIQKGQRVQKDTTLSSFGNLLNVNQYYRNGFVGLSHYTNGYHFASLPIVLEWRLSKASPFALTGGIAINQLIATNALNYSPSAQVYYQDQRAFRHTQLFSDIGLQYTISNKKNTVSFGPQLLYGFSKYSKSNSDNHLFSLALKARMFFNK